MRRIRRLVVRILILGLLALAGLLLYGHARTHPEDMPWTALDLSQPLGAFTGRKLADLADEGERCQGLLDRAGIGFARMPDRSSQGGQCGYRGAVRLDRAGALRIGYRPAAPTMSCGVAAGLALWEWNVVQPAAFRFFGQEVVAIDHLGTYNCRRINGSSKGAWSEHATANAVDIAGFGLADGTRISVLSDWSGSGDRARFLR